MDGKGGHGLKRRAVGPTFSSFNAMLQTTTATLGTEKIGHCREVLNKSQRMDFSVCLDEKKKWPLAEVRLYSISSSELYWGILCTDNKALQDRIDIKQQYLQDIALSFSMRISQLNKKLVSAVGINGCLCSTRWKRTTNMSYWGVRKAGFDCIWLVSNQTYQ